MAFIKELFIGVIIISSLFMGLAGMYGSLTDSYGVTANETEIESLSMMSDIYDTLEEAQDQFIGEGAETESLGIAMLSSSWNFLVQLFYSVPLVQTMIVDVAELLRVPQWMVVMVEGLLLLLFVLALLKSTIKVDV